MSEVRRFEAAELRRAFGTFLTGVTVVTAPGQGGAPFGMTANSFTSVSLDPPLVLVCIGSGATGFAHFAATPVFAVNILKEGQTEVASLFARRGADKFAGVAHRVEATGAPILEECLAWFDCRLHQRVVAGDHVILIGRVEAFATSDHPPLGYSRGAFVVALPPPPPSGRSPSPVGGGDATAPPVSPPPTGEGDRPKGGGGGKAASSIRGRDL